MRERPGWALTLPVMDESKIAAAILGACADRGPHSSVCPSEIARSLSPQDWRALMEPVRDAAVALARAGKLRITQRGVEVDPGHLHGPIRLSLRLDDE